MDSPEGIRVKKTASHETHNFFMSGNFGFYFPEISESIPTGSRVIVRLKSQKIF